MTTFSTLPLCICPNCSKEFEWDDYYDVKDGSEYVCPNCDEEIIAIDADKVIEVRLGVKKQWTKFLRKKRNSRSRG